MARETQVLTITILGGYSQNITIQPIFQIF
jgi:hypothetical protein